MAPICRPAAPSLAVWRTMHRVCGLGASIWGGAARCAQRSVLGPRGFRLSSEAGSAGLQVHFSYVEPHCVAAVDNAARKRLFKGVIAGTQVW